MEYLKKYRATILFVILLVLWGVGLILLISGLDNRHEGHYVIPGGMFICTGVWLLFRLTESPAGSGSGTGSG